MFARPFDLTLLPYFPLISVFKCCFTMTRSEMDLIGITITWNKDIMRKRVKAREGFRTQTHWPCPLGSWTLVLGAWSSFLPLPPSSTLGAGRVLSSAVSGGVKERLQIRNMEGGIGLSWRAELYKSKSDAYEVERQRDCYRKLEGICFESVWKNHLSWICANKPQWEDHRDEPALPLLYDFVYRTLLGL